MVTLLVDGKNVVVLANDAHLVIMKQMTVSKAQQRVRQMKRRQEGWQADNPAKW